MARTNTNGLSNKTYIGIDNGVSGSVGWVNSIGTESASFTVPTFSCLNYQKSAKNITRIDTEQLKEELRNLDNPFAVLERPMVNPGRFAASTSALRALEATLIVLEALDIPHMFVDSRDWQKVLLPKGVKGDALKKASFDIGCRLFPHLRQYFRGDADGILIAEWARRKGL